MALEGTLPSPGGFVSPRSQLQAAWPLRTPEPHTRQPVEGRGRQGLPCAPQHSCGGAALPCSRPKGPLAGTALAEASCAAGPVVEREQARAPL